MHNKRLEVAVARLAADQAGVVTRRQALRAGFTTHQLRHRVRYGMWALALPGVYRIASTSVTDESRMWAALLWAGAGAALSHHTAGQVWQFDDVGMQRPELLVPTSCAKRCADVTTRRTRALPPLDFRHVRGMRVSSPERTLLDLAGVLDEEALEIAFESARRERLVTVGSVQRCVERSGTHGRSGTASLRSLLLQLQAEPSESALEVRASRLLRRSTLPRPRQQFEVGCYRLDFAWPERRVALECDGRRRHFEDADFQHDRTKLTDLACDGWRVLVATSADVRARGAALIAKLDRALTQGG